METDPYKILGIEDGASLAEVKKAHRKLVKQYHPDMSTGDREKYELVQRAYEVLTDKRKEVEDRQVMNPWLVHNHLFRSIWGEMNITRVGQVRSTYDE